MKLTKSQKAALDYIANYAKNRKKEAEAVIKHVLFMSNISLEMFHQAVNKLKKHARIALHFHPDRPDPQMKTVAQALLEQGFYKNQFETFISNGKLSPAPGGERDLWEQRLFGGAYQQESSASCRPKYGALQLMMHPDGPSPRFGSCYFFYILKLPAVPPSPIWIRIKNRRNEARSIFFLYNK